MLQQASVSRGRQTTRRLENELTLRLPGAGCEAPLYSPSFEGGLRNRQPRRWRRFVQSNFASRDEACAAHQHPLRFVNDKPSSIRQRLTDIQSVAESAVSRCPNVPSTTHPSCTKVLILNPSVGLTAMKSSPSSLFKMVVFPALSSPLRGREISAAVWCGRSKDVDSQEEDTHLPLLPSVLPDDRK